MSRKRILNESQEATSAKRRHISGSQDASQIGSTQSEYNLAVRSGKILRIHLTNFMCHSNLVMDFNRRVNLLVGSNGSGKSAILTALVVGLGTKARDTNRSTSIKQLVKNGEISSTIEIDIANDGPDAFERGTYGNKITVVRQISDKGVSQYKIKNEQGQIISKRTDDLHKILLYHNIQTDNPVFVLNQDSARSFLKELDPSKNYQLFLKATQIEIITKKLNECGLMHNDHKYRLECHKKQTDILKKQVIELTDKYERLRSLEDIKENVKRYKLEKLWVKVSNQEKLIENARKEITEKTEQKDEILWKIQNKEEAENELRNKVRQLEEELSEKNFAITEENKKLQNLKENFTRENERYELEQRQCKKLEDRIKHLQEQIVQLESSIAERSESCTARINRMREKNEAKMAELRFEIEEIQALISNAKRDLDLHYNRKQQLMDQFENVKSKRLQTINQISAISKDMSRLAASTKDSLQVYGKDMSALLLAIERKSRSFSALPRGPVGKFVQVPNEKWRGVVEHLLAGVLHAFLVNSAKDRFLLDKIIKEGFPEIKPLIVTTKFHNEVYDVRKGMVVAPRGTRLLMDEIKCSDPVVMNCLIDRIRIETILLTEDQNVAVNVSSDIENVPRNLFRVMLLKPFLDYRPAPMYRVYSLKPRIPRYLQVDISQRKRQLQREIEQSNQMKGTYEAQMQKMDADLREVNVLLQQLKDILHKNENNQHSKKTKLEELQNIEYPSENEVEILTKELVEIQNKLESTRKELEKRKQNCLGYHQNKIDREKEFNEQKRRIRSIEDDINRACSECDKLKLKLHSQLNELKRQENYIKELDALVNTREKEVKNMCTELQRYVKSAQHVGDRVETRKSEEELETQIKKLERKVQNISTDDNIDDIKALLEEKRMSLEKNECIAEAITETLDLLKKSRLQRFRSIVNLKKHMAIKLKYTFDSILKLRRYTGELNIDHQNQKLTMSVIPRDNHIDNAVSNTKSLSGGERSYTTVAFLLALWSCVDHPFYFLDEYDVFTDQVNRQIMTRLLLSEADKKPHRQYTFLTPQDMSFIEASDTIKIHRLTDPRS